MTREELYDIRGGIQTISAAMINAMIKTITTAYDLGKAVGSAIRRAVTGSKCK